MNISQLLEQRETLLRQARLANLAFAWVRLSRLARRIERAGLRGRVTLRPPDPDEGRPWPTLAACDGSQAVIEEHFLDEDVLELEEVLTFLRGEGIELPSTFALDEFPRRHLGDLRQTLAGAGVALPEVEPRTEDSNRELG